MSYNPTFDTPMNQIEKIRLREATGSLQSYIISEEYRGYDPYDGLMSPLFKLPLLRSNNLLRFAFQQVFKKLPINLRALIGIKKGLNPVTLGLCIEAYSYLSEVFKENVGFYTGQINYCLDKLIELRSPSHAGSCWGYDFDWEARYSKIPALAPTVVATGIIENALFEYYVRFKDSRARNLIVYAADFVAKDLNRSYEGDTFCFSYSPDDSEMVYNATMKGARILTHAYTISGNESFIRDAKKTVHFVINHQNEDGSWFYSFGDARKWTDNFHTAYVLECLKAYCDVTADKEVCNHLAGGLRYYVDNFFAGSGGIAKYYNDAIYPLDSTAIAQSILTLTHFDQIELASKVMNWTVQNMQSSEGYIYYLKKRFLTNKISYMRWSNAWMFAAFSSLLLVADENSLD